jgi:hypothetical protein
VTEGRTDDNDRVRVVGVNDGDCHVALLGTLRSPLIICWLDREVRRRRSCDNDGVHSIQDAALAESPGDPAEPRPPAGASARRGPEPTSGAATSARYHLWRGAAITARLRHVVP